MTSPALHDSQVAQLTGTSAWFRTTQPWVDGYSTLTGDADWLHNDPERAAAEGPFGGPIVPGFLLLATLTKLQNEIAAATTIADPTVPPLNYGFDRMRFVRPVLIGRRIRLTSVVADAHELSGRGVRVAVNVQMEVADEDDRPAVAAIWLFLLTSTDLTGRAPDPSSAGATPAPAVGAL